MRCEDGSVYVLAYPQPHLGLSNISHNNIQHNRDSYMDMEKIQLHTERRCIMIDSKIRR